MNATVPAYPETPPDCCDIQRLWGGMAWFPHTDEDHRLFRSGLLWSFRERLLMRAGTLAGHVITLRFTASVAFFECSCGINGPLWPSSAYARRDGESHLYRIGGIALLAMWQGQP